VKAIAPIEGLEFRPLSGSIGVEVLGAELQTPASPGLRDALRQALLDADGVLVFPNQFVTPAAQHEFALMWGDPIVSPHLASHAYPDHLDVLRVTNVGKERAVTEQWHCDSIFLDAPPPITILAAQDLPAAGGDTMWANQYLAYDRLSVGMQRMLDGLQGVFVGDVPDPETGIRSEVRTLHPIVRVHPETGRKALLAGHPGDSLVCLEDMTDAESRPLLDFLYDHATQPDLVYRHHWRPGDLVMWDNRCTMHYAVHDYGDSDRSLSRVTISG
jgi:taurine dioxygenase